MGQDTKRGMKEQNCLDLVKRGFFWRNDMPCEEPFGHRTILNATDDEFNNGLWQWLVNHECYKSCFGLLEDDRFEIASILRTAKPNERLSEFPDFIFQKGFIEHFQVTSSKTTRKGAEHKKDEQAFKSAVQKEQEEVRKQWEHEMECNTLRSTSWTFEYGAHSYEDLKKSFQDSWEKHLQSLEKYNGTKEIGIFMIEYDESALGMIECVYTDWINGMSQGDMRKQEDFKNYRLSRDKKILNYIYQFKDKIRYVIYVYRDGFEIIRTDNIPYLLKLMPWDYMIYPMIVQERQTMSCIRWEMKMSKLDEMIRELCPDGVEYKRFDEVCTLNARIGWQRLTKAEYMSKGDYLLITGTDFTETHEIDYSTCVYVTEERYKQDLKIQLKNGDVLITKDGTLGKVAQVKGLEMPATLNGGVFVVRCKDSSLENRFILHYLLSNHFQSVVEQQKTGSTISHLTQTLFSRLMIPIPPLEIQREIVRILDNFTKLTAELTVELTARKTQYDFYRDKLLTFESKIQLLSLKDIAKFSYGYTDKAQEHGDTRFCVSQIFLKTVR